MCLSVCQIFDDTVHVCVDLTILIRLGGKADVRYHQRPEHRQAHY